MTRETRDADASGPLVRTAATWFGLGHARFAPGTLAALTMLPVHWLLERGPRPLEIAVARQCASLHVPDPMPERDAMIAATALVHGMTLVTRNVGDFQRAKVRLFNPWLDS